MRQVLVSPNQQINTQQTQTSAATITAEPQTDPDTSESVSDISDQCPIYEPVVIRETVECQPNRTLGGELNRDIDYPRDLLADHLWLPWVLLFVSLIINGVLTAFCVRLRKHHYPHD